MTDCQWAFEQLKSLFVKEPVLKHPDLSKSFVVQADTSEVAVGAVLLQVNEWALQPCVYMSWKLNNTERNWPIWEKEAFAVQWGLLTWQHLLGVVSPLRSGQATREGLHSPCQLSLKQNPVGTVFPMF